MIDSKGQCITSDDDIYNLNRVQSTWLYCKNGGKEENDMGLGLTDKTRLSVLVAQGIRSRYFGYYLDRSPIISL